MSSHHHRKESAASALAAALVGIAAAAITTMPAQASHVAPRPGCHDDGHGAIVCLDCIPPMRWDGNQCLPPVIVPVMPATPAPQYDQQCRVLVRYEPAKPAQATLDEPAAHCDRAGLELALAAALARLLGAPLP